MGASYRPDNPFAPGPPANSAKKSYRPDNPFAPKEDAKDEPPTEDSPAGAFLAPLAQGATLGFADEILGGIHAANAFLPKALGGEGLPLRAERTLSDLITGEAPRGGLEGFKARYREGTDKIRRGGDAFAKAHPVGNVALEVAGGAIPAIGAGPIAALTAPGKSLAKRAALSAVEGAGFGAVAGAGGARGGIGARAKGAAEGGVAGALVGGALPAAADAVGVVRNIVGRRGSSAGRQADALLRRALGRDNVAVGDLPARAAEMAGKPAVLPDLAGENVLGLARGAQATPSRAKESLAEMLTRRQREQPGRVAADVEGSLGVQRGNVFQTADDLAKARSEHAAPLYQQAFAHGAVDNPRINALLQLPYFQKAWQQAKRLAALDEKQLPEILETHATPTDVSKYGAQLEAQGVDPAIFAERVKAGKIPQIPATTETTAARQVPTVEALHYLKLGLDDVIQDAMRAPLDRGGLSPLAATKVLAKQREFLSLLDKEVPAYAKARDAYAGDTRMMEALDQGRSFTKTRPELVQRHMADLGASERDMYKAGVIDDIRSQMDHAADGRDVVARIFGSAEKRAQLQALFHDPGEFAALERKMAQESRMGRTKERVLGGSPTARIQTELGELGEGRAAQLAGTYATSGVRGVVTKGAMAIMRRMQGNVGDVADELSQRMSIAPGSPEFDALMARLQPAPPAQRALPGPVVRRMLGAGAGGGTQ